MRNFLNHIRKPKYNISVGRRAFNTVLILILGLVLGYISKFLDCTASNRLPHLIEVLDLRNFFSRMAIWILIAVAISIYSNTPVRAGINTFLFFSGMLVSYYAYTKFAAGFFPVRYILIWVRLTVLSPLLAFVCWYAKGKGIAALILASLIAGTLFIQAFSYGMFYFNISYPLDAAVWLAGIIMLYQSPKQLAGMMGLSIIFGIVLNAVLPFRF